MKDRISGALMKNSLSGKISVKFMHFGPQLWDVYECRLPRIHGSQNHVWNVATSIAMVRWLGSLCFPQMHQPKMLTTMYTSLISYENVLVEMGTKDALLE